MSLLGARIILSVSFTIFSIYIYNILKHSIVIQFSSISYPHTKSKFSVCLFFLCHTVMLSKFIFYVVNTVYAAAYLHTVYQPTVY